MAATAENQEIVPRPLPKVFLPPVALAAQEKAPDRPADSAAADAAAEGRPSVWNLRAAAWLIFLVALVNIALTMLYGQDAPVAEQGVLTEPAFLPEPVSSGIVENRPETTHTYISAQEKRLLLKERTVSSQEDNLP